MLIFGILDKCQEIMSKIFFYDCRERLEKIERERERDKRLREERERKEIERRKKREEEKYKEAQARLEGIITITIINVFFISTGNHFKIRKTLLQKYVQVIILV